MKGFLFMSFAERDFLISIAKMYYKTGRSQQEIADHFNVSRSQVSKFLTKAKKMGIVEITINEEVPNNFGELEQELEKRFSMRKVIICGSDNTNFIKETIAQAALDYFLRILKPNNIVAIAGGSTTNLMASKYPYTHPMESVTFVPFSGGLGKSHQDIQTNVVCEVFGRHSGGNFFQLYAPVIVDSSLTKNILMKETFVDSIFTLCKKADISVIGIGTALGWEEMNSEYFTKDRSLAEINRDRIVADVSYTFIDKEGKKADCRWNDRAITLDIEDMKNVPIRMGVAGGIEKAEAIATVMKGQIINTLVTDVITAQKLLKY
jgi:deoxyribonucleoside regulator